MRPQDITYVCFQPPYYVSNETGRIKYRIRTCSQLSIKARHCMNNDGPTYSFAICWLDRCCVLSHLWTRQMNRVNVILFIMFLEDLVRFALISGSSVRETLWSRREREKEKKNCLRSLNWEPHTQWKRHSSYVNLLHPKFVFQNQSVNILIGTQFMIAALAHSRHVWSQMES